MTRSWLAVVLALEFVCAIHASAEEPGPAAVFEQRIMPIFKSPDPSSCVQCHLSSVDLKDYILPSSRGTFLSLRAKGLINQERPQDSKILHLIAMGDSDPDSMSRRIHAKVRKAEYEAFAAWIEACCKDKELAKTSQSRDIQSIGPSKPVAVIRHTRKDRVLDSFVRNIWSQRMRCFPCHTPAELDPGNPMHALPIKRFNEFVDQYGGRMKLFKETPEETLQSLVASSRKRHGDDLPLINVADPLNSLLLLKPTAKLPAKDSSGKIGKPSASLPVSHMGGIKMHKDDHSYKAFALWLQDYADSVAGRYEESEALPRDNWYPTEHVLRIKNLPNEWPNLSTVQIFVHAWNGERQSWSDLPIAFTQSKVTPRKMVNGSLFVLAKTSDKDRFDSEGETLAAGKVQLRVFLDRSKAIESNPTLMLNFDRDSDATVVIEASFRKGFKNAEVVDGETLKFNR